MINDKDFKDFHYNVLGAKSKVTGDLILSGDTIINSVIEGTIEVEGHGKLVLERGSIVKGKIKAIDLEIFGSVEGEIECSGLLSIRSSAFVQGQIKSGRLVIYPGAIVEMNASSME
ncbi:MAG: polymer-forming cytoskeletal protein [Bacteriovoracaceae bacterium]|nr:polymer-forming cytoskeletal protein [Bacteriovoracaceae bacterium]